MLDTIIKSTHPTWMIRIHHDKSLKFIRKNNESGPLQF